MPLATKPSVVTQAIVDVLETNKVALGLAEIYYGPQGLIPEFPAAEVSSLPMTREIKNIHQYQLTLRSSVLILFGKIQAVETNTKGSEEKAEAVQDQLHLDNTLDGNVLFGYITRIEPGVAIRKATPLRATRLIFEGISREAF